MKKLLMIFLLLCSNVVIARTLKIVKLSTETIRIGKNRVCKVGSKFEETEEIKWDSPKQDMWVKVVSGESRELMHFTREAFISKKAKTPAEYFLKINHPSVRADEMSYLSGNNKSSFPEKRLALVIGNSNYDYLSSLNNPINDATDVTDKLQSLGFDVYSLYDINYSDFDTVLKKFSGAAKNYDVALIYYCGHGIQYDGLNYLIPVDTKLVNADDLLRCIDLEDIYSKLNRTSCSTKLLFLDACRNEAPWKEKVEHFNEQDANGIRVVFSTGPNKFSYDGIPNRNSPFAEAFLQNIGKASPNVLLTINEIANSLINISEQMGLPAQEVHDFGSSFIDFTFVSDDNTSSYEETNTLSNQVLINASLLDSVYVKTDPFISKKIDYNEYMGVSLYDNGEIELGPFYDSFHYIETNKDGYTVIRPYGEYVGDYYLNDSITIQDHSFLMFGERDFTNEHHPVLDVTLVNNSENTILVNELLIDVEESYLDKNPFVIFYESGGEIEIEDKGWKPWKNAKFRFSLLPDNQPFDGKYKFERTLYPSEEGMRIPMYDYFVQSGIDYSKICSSSIVHERENGEIPEWDSDLDSDSVSIDTLKKLLYPIELNIEKLFDVTGEEVSRRYIDPYLVLHGELIFDNNSRFKVGGTVRFLTSEGWGAPYLECSRLVDVKLRTEGNNYTIKYPVSHYLKKGDVDRIAIQLDADKTSYHKFRVRLHNAQQIDIKTDPIDLLIFKYH